jgi:hypothetical protein
MSPFGSRAAAVIPASADMDMNFEPRLVQVTVPSQPPLVDRHRRKRPVA